MNKSERLKFAEKKMQQERFIITFTDSEAFQVFINSPYVRDNINFIAVNKKLLKIDIEFNKDITIGTMTEKLVSSLGIANDTFKITNKGFGLANLFPL